MAAAFGRPVDQVLSQLSEKPVAAASLGQVYRGRLSPALGGTEVAIKVQRPDVLDTVCLDLYLMRRLAVAIQSLPDITTDWAALIDNWAVRFLHEMDYEREAANAAVFKGQMAEAGVTGVVTAPVVGELSSDVVLTTEWITGGWVGVGGWVGGGGLVGVGGCGVGGWVVGGGGGGGGGWGVWH
jgi:aarF domain-containing kinase